MTSISNVLLTAVINYGVPMLCLALFLGALGLPLPGSLLVIAAGAFSKQGELDLVSAAAFGFAATLMGDSLSYSIGWLAGDKLKGRLQRLPAWNSTSKFFQARGSLSIFLSRWVLTSTAIPINLIAGGSDYRFWKFLTFDAAGELTWFILYGGLGYLFGSEWELISDFLSNVGGLLFGVLALGAGLYFYLRSRSQKGRVNA